MINARIDINGEMKDVQLFEDMYDYVSWNGSDISHYTINRYDEGQFITEEENLLFDDDFIVGEIIEIEGEEYTKVNWGESEVSFIKSAGINQELYSIYQKVGNVEYQNYRSMLFESREEAQEKVNELCKE